MSDHDLAEARYRITGKTVEAFHDGEWIVAYYCVSEEAAIKCRAECIKRYIAHLHMTPEERRRGILR
jgi:hypothetical protein